ncbi:MAG: DNA repair protein RadC [Gemmatimonadetes bacterium]|jgi:DNA repair protein RadC|nr:DNA repair protein RadC [Gemmatimonadota bacterium]
MNSIQVYRLRLVREAQLNYDPITQPLEAENAVRIIARRLLDGLDREAGIVLALDSRNRPIGCHVVSIGSLSASLIHPREVFKFAILANAASLIFAHNHPSGDPTPSKDDIELTRRLVSAGQLLGIEVIDALITGYDHLLSFKERGLI